MRGSAVLIAAAAGAAWGAMALALYSAMVRGAVPSYGELTLPLAALVVIATIPFQAATGVLTLLGSRSSLVELVAMTLSSGAVMGVLVAATLRGIARPRVSGG